MMVLVIIIVAVIVQRLSELVVSRRNITWALARGGREEGAGHYWMFIVLHTAWIISMAVEWFVRKPALHDQWPYLLGVIVAAQGLRYWALLTLGRRWNTRIIVMDGEPLVVGGPYRWMRHPNYVAVAIEIFTIPALLGCWGTAAMFTVLNALILMFIRIPAEEAALERSTGGGT